MNNLGRGKENEKKDKSKILTRETVGIVLLLFAALAFLVVVTDRLIFGGVGHAIRSFLLGVFGFAAYAVLAAWIYGGVVLITGKRLSASRKLTALCVLCFLIFVCLVHTITADVAGIPYGGYGAYLGDCYAAGGNGYFGSTGGGVLLGIVVYPIVKLTTSVGGYIIFSLLLLGTGYLIYRTVKGGNAEKRRARLHREQKERTMVESAASDTSALYDLHYAGGSAETGAPAEVPFAADPAMQAPPAQPAQTERSRRLYAIGDAFDMKTKRELRQETRREEAQQRAEEQPLSPYQQSRQILYPETPASSWMPSYLHPASAGSGQPRKEEPSAPFSSYTSNGIFDSDSYFNRPRGVISGAQYASDNFGSGQQAKQETAAAAPASGQPMPQDPPAAAQPAQAGGVYSELYTDGLDENITYSSVPRKIVTDTTVPQAGQNASSYAAPLSSPPQTERGAAAPQEAPRSFAENVPERGQDEQAPSASFSAERGEETPASYDRFARIEPPQAGGQEEYTRIRPLQGGEPSEPFRRDETDDAAGGALRRGDSADAAERTFRGGESGDAFGRDGMQRYDAPAEAERPPQADAFASRGGQERPSYSGERFGARREEDLVPDEEDADAQLRRGESGAGLRHMEEGLDSAVNLFDDEEPAEPSAVPAAMDEIRRGRGEERSALVPQEEPKRKKHVYARYKAPSLDLLENYMSGIAGDAEEIEQNKNTIVETLSNLHIPCEVVKVTQGPAVTRYDIETPGHIPASRVLSYDRELAMRLRAKDGVNVKTNYENGSISIEVPNKQRATVGLKEIIRSEQFTSAKPGSLMFGLGKDIEGRVILGNVVKMKHMLVAGSTGSGKSVCLNALIISLLYKYSPEELRIILVDPKQVEFNIYERLPHLMIDEIIYEPPKVINALSWCINEMERRYSLFKQKSKTVLVRDIDEYNAHLQPDEERLPKIVFIIDELADLMQTAKKEIEDRIQRLTQKSRAAGIHLVLATQRPSVDVITGVIKNNLLTRIAFKVTAEVDSRTILDETGAEKLLGNGDMLYRTDTMTFPVRVQGAFLNSDEVQRVVEYVKANNEAYFDDSVADYMNNNKGGGGAFGGESDDNVEAVYIEALRHVVDIGQASISMIQRRCSVGYPKAGKIIEWMENMGYISAFDGSKARKVLLSKEEFESKYGEYGD